MGMALVALAGWGIGAAPAAGPADYVVTPMRVQEMKGFNYLHATAETTMAKMGEVLGPKSAGLHTTTMHPTGPMTLILRGAGMDQNKPILLQVGLPVAEDTSSGSGEYQVKTLPTFRCAAVVFSGPIKQVGKVYPQLYKDLYSAGLQPTGETRQVFLLWDGPDSANNVVLIEVGVKGGTP